MAWELFEDGKSLGVVVRVQVREGYQGNSRRRSFDGADQMMPDQWDPGTVAFLSVKRIDAAKTHELRESRTNQRIQIVIDKMNGVSVNAHISA